LQITDIYVKLPLFKQTIGGYFNDLTQSIVLSFLLKYAYYDIVYSVYYRFKILCWEIMFEKEKGQTIKVYILVVQPNKSTASYAVSLSCI